MTTFGGGLYCRGCGLTAGHGFGCPVAELEKLRAALAEKDARIVKIEARLALATKALKIIDPDRIRLLRMFLDLEQSRGRWGGSSGEAEVQDDLWRFEELQRAALKEIGGE